MADRPAAGTTSPKPHDLLQSSPDSHKIQANQHGTASDDGYQPWEVDDAWMMDTFVLAIRKYKYDGVATTECRQKQWRSCRYR